MQNYEFFVERAHDLTKSNKKKEISVIHVMMVTPKYANSFYEIKIILLFPKSGFCPNSLGGSSLFLYCMFEIANLRSVKKIPNFGALRIAWKSSDA